jgi:hypothetical protein
MKHEWLKRITIESRMPITSEPFDFALNGETYTGATDGTIVVLVKSEAQGLPDGNDSSIGKRLTKWFSERFDGVELGLDELRAWAKVKERLCCPFCEGSGSRLTTPIDAEEFYESVIAAPVRLCGVLINRDALALPLHFAESASGKVTAYVASEVEVKEGMEGSAIRIDADNLTFILMGLNEKKVSDDEVIDSFPKQ